MLNVITRGIALAGFVMLVSIGQASAQSFYDPALDSTAGGGEFGYTTDTTWQNADQQAAVGNSIAPQGQTFNTGTQGWADTNGADLPSAEQGLMAVAGKHNRAACGFHSSSGFSGGGSGNFGGSALPPCATSCVRLDTAF